MSKYVPDDLKNMSESELLEVALIMHEKNVRLAKQLAKSNERVKELDEKNHEYAICIITICDRADIQDYIRRNPTYEKASEHLNKFALEQKCKSVSELNAYFVNRANRESEMLPIYFPDWCNDFREQLHKERDYE